MVEVDYYFHQFMLKHLQKRLKRTLSFTVLKAAFFYWNQVHLNTFKIMNDLLINRPRQPLELQFTNCFKLLNPCLASCFMFYVYHSVVEQKWRYTVQLWFIDLYCGRVTAFLARLYFLSGLQNVMRQWLILS